MSDLSTEQATSVAENLAQAAAETYQEHLAAGDAAGARSVLQDLAGDLDQILTTIGPGSTGYSQVALMTAYAQDECWALTDDPACLEASIQYARAGLRGCTDVGLAAELRMVLASGLGDSYASAITDDAVGADVVVALREEAIEVLASVLDDLPPGDPMWPGAADLLGRLWYDRYLNTSDGRAALDAAISLLSAAA